MCRQLVPGTKKGGKAHHRQWQGRAAFAGCLDPEGSGRKTGSSVEHRILSEIHSLDHHRYHPARKSAP